MIDSLVQKYGKQLIKELISIMVIRGNVNGVDFKPLLLKHKIITRNTKTVKAYYRKYQPNGRRPDGSWGALNDMRHALELKNGSGRILIYLVFNESELPTIMEGLND